jgi:two-component system, response regulator YesN
MEKISLIKLKNSNYFEYLYYFIILSVLTTVILGGALYFYFSSLLRSENIESNNNMLDQLKSAQEVILSEVDNSLAHIVMDPFINKYEDYCFGKDLYVQKMVHDKLENTILLNKYIDSIFLYYYNSDLILSSKAGDTAVDNFYDSEYLKRLLNSNITHSFVENRTMKEYKKDTNVEVLSLVKPIPIMFNNRPTALLVINIKSQYLQETISSINIKRDSSVFIYSNEGKLITQYGQVSNLKNVSILNYISAEDNANRGHDVKNINGQKTLLSFVNSDKYLWKYVYAIPMATINYRIQFIGRITILFCIFVLVLGALGAAFFSERIYSPIKSALSMFVRGEKSFKENEDREPVKEVTMLQRSIYGLIDRNKSLESIMKDYEVYDRNKFLQGWVSGNLEIDESKYERLEYYNIKLDLDGYYVACVIAMDNYDEFWNKYSEKQHNMMSNYMKENIASTIFKENKGFIVETDRNELGVIINFSASEDLEEVKVTAYNLAKQLHTLIIQDGAYSFTVAVSTVHKGVEEIVSCYREGLTALNYKLLLGHNQVIVYETIGSKMESNQSYPFFIEKNILSNLRVGNRDELFNGLDEFMEYISNNITVNIGHVRHYFLQLISSSIKCAYEIDMNVDEVFKAQKNVYEILLQEETIQEMYLCTVTFYETVLNYLEEKRDCKNKELITLVTEYIKENLAADLSIEGIADKFYISSSHLRKLFKDENGETIKTYISNLRIDMAKELLTDPKIKIYDIAVNIGYLSVQAFTKAFKLYTGKAPGEYRSQVLLKTAKESEE